MTEATFCPKGSLHVVATPIGNLDDISPRAVKTLGAVDLILAEDTRHSRTLFSRYGIRTPTLSYHKFNEEGRAAEIVERIVGEGLRVAVVSDAGVPCISDPGMRLVRAARDAGIPVYGISGPSAITTALSVSGLPCDEFVFFGFLPRTKGKLRQSLGDIRTRGIPTFVVFESPKRVLALAQAILEEFPTATACFLREMTKIHETAYYGPIAEVVRQLETDPNSARGEYTAVIHVKHEAERFVAGSIAGQASDVVGAGLLREGLSLEAHIAQTMLEEGCTLKDAISKVSRVTGAPRKEAYGAGVRLRSLFTRDEERE